MKKVTYITNSSNYDNISGKPQLKNDESIFRAFSYFLEYIDSVNTCNVGVDFTMVLDSKTTKEDREFLKFISNDVLGGDVTFEFIDGYSTTFESTAVKMYGNEEIKQYHDDADMFVSEIPFDGSEDNLSTIIAQYQRDSEDPRFISGRLMDIMDDKPFVEFDVLGLNSFKYLLASYKKYFSEQKQGKQLTELVLHSVDNGKTVTIFDDEIFGDDKCFDTFFSEGHFKDTDTILVVNPTNFESSIILDMMFASGKRNSTDIGEENVNIVILDKTDDVDRLGLVYVLASIKENVRYFHSDSKKVVKRQLFN